MVNLKSVSMKHLYDKMMDTEGLDDIVDQFGYVKPGYINVRDALSGVINEHCNILRFGGLSVTFVQHDMTITYDDLVPLLQDVYKDHGYYVQVCYLDCRDVFENDFYLNPGVIRDPEYEDSMMCTMREMYDCFRSEDCTRREWDLRTNIKAELDSPAIYEVMVKSVRYLLNFKYTRKRMPLDINGIAVEKVQKRMLESYLGKEWEKILDFDSRRDREDIKERWFGIEDLNKDLEGVYDTKTEILIYRGGTVRPFIIMPKKKVLAKPFLSMTSKNIVRFGELPIILCLVERICDMLYMNQEYGLTIAEMTKNILNRFGGGLPEWVHDIIIDIISTRVAPFRAILELPQVITEPEYIITTKMKEFICALPNVEIVELKTMPDSDKAYDVELFKKLREKDLGSELDIYQNVVNMIDNSVDTFPCPYMDQRELIKCQGPDIVDSTISIGYDDMLNSDCIEWKERKGTYGDKNLEKYLWYAPGYREGYYRSTLQQFDPKFYGFKLKDERIIVSLKSHYSLEDKYIGGVYYKEKSLVAYGDREVSFYTFEPYTSESQEVQMACQVLWDLDYPDKIESDSWYRGLKHQVLVDFRRKKFEREKEKFNEQRSCIDWENIRILDWG